MSDSENSDDYDGLLKKALDVELPLNFDPQSIPQNGEEYLHHVIYERSRCKKLITVNFDRSKFKHKQTVHVSEKNVAKEAPNHCKPTREWQISKIDDFTNFREYVHSQISTEPVLLTFDENNFIERIKEVSPTFSNITQYSQSSKITMLQIITKDMDLLEPGESIKNNLGVWIYAILTLLEIPLSPNCCYVLREFSRKCTVIRSRLNDNANESLYVPLNLFICIIAIYFNQLDLID